MELPGVGPFILKEASNSDMTIVFKKPIPCNCRYYDDGVWVYEYDSDLFDCFHKTYRSGYGYDQQEAYDDLMDAFCCDYKELVINSDEDCLTPGAIGYVNELKAAIESVNWKEGEYVVDQDIKKILDDLTEQIDSCQDVTEKNRLQQRVVELYKLQALQDIAAVLWRIEDKMPGGFV